MFKIEFKTSNAAFHDERDPYMDMMNKRTEINRILKVVGLKVILGDTFGVCIDDNGNHIGTWELTED